MVDWVQDISCPTMHLFVLNVEDFTIGMNIMWYSKPDISMRLACHLAQWDGLNTSNNSR